MPCYEVRQVNVFFHIENTDLLKKALLAQGFRIYESKTTLGFYDKAGRTITINFDNSQISSSDKYYNEKNLTDLSNQIKRAYSLEVISKVASAGKWFSKKISENKYQLNRY